MKRCTKCGAKDFESYKSKPERCKECVKTTSRKYRKENPEKVRATDKKRYTDERRERIYFAHVKKKYGLSESEYRAILAAQGGHCAICPSTDRLVVEHNHDTGEVRGIVCNRCNTALGMSDDSPTRLLALAQYLLDRGHYGPQ